jgi:hypothetical protein
MISHLCTLGVIQCIPIIFCATRENILLADPCLFLYDPAARRQLGCFMLARETLHSTRPSCRAALIASVGLMSRVPNHQLLRSRSWLPWVVPSQGPSRPSSQPRLALRALPASTPCSPVRTSRASSVQLRRRRRAARQHHRAYRSSTQRTRSTTHSLGECEIACPVGESGQ